MTRTRFIAAAAALSLTFPAGVLANPATQQYLNPIKKASPPKSSMPATVSQAPPSSGTLPFTGENLGFAVGAGVALVGVGFGLRRFGSRRSG